jgi:hypothetical protein
VYFCLIKMMAGVLVSDAFHELVYSMHQYNYKGITLVV